ncbi:MAG: hypothetical protein Q9209_007354 [Squamulea sp. 1 TL-2023]
MAGEMDDGGDGTFIPVLGFTIGIALRLLWEAEDKEKLGVTCCCGWICCCRGDECGEPLDSEPSEEDEWMDCSYVTFFVSACWNFEENSKMFGMQWGRLTSSSVNNPGQNSRSSSRSKDLPASKRARKAEIGGLPVNSFMLRTPRNCLWVLWEADKRGALLDRWLCDEEG